VPKSNTYEASLLALLLNGVGITGVADNTASSPLANLYVALHTGNPAGSGNQTTNEISYTGYARVAVGRSSGSPFWTIAGSSPASAQPGSTITFGNMTGGAGGTVTYISIGSASSGAGEIFYYGTVAPNIVVSAGVSPQISAASAVTES
jgi:hypothetical protein